MALTTFSFIQSHADYTLFTRDQVELWVFVYVDDLLICGKDSPTLTKFKDYLGSCFHLKNLGKLKYFFSPEVA